MTSGGATRVAGIVLVVLAAFTTGCFGGGTELPSSVPGEPLAPDARRLARLTEALGKPDADRLALTASALALAGVSPIADAKVPGAGGRFVTGASGQTLAGWIPGRIPIHRDSLVMIVAPRDGTRDLALIEAARMLVASGAYTQIPARSVLIVLGDDVRAVQRLWTRTAVVRRIDLTDEIPQGQSTFSEGAKATSALSLSGTAVQMATPTFDALLAATTPPSPYVRAARD